MRVGLWGSVSPFLALFMARVAFSYPVFMYLRDQLFIFPFPVVSLNSFSLVDFVRSSGLLLWRWGSHACFSECPHSRTSAEHRGQLGEMKT